MVSPETAFATPFTVPVDAVAVAVIACVPRQRPFAAALGTTAWNAFVISNGAAKLNELETRLAGAIPWVSASCPAEEPEEFTPFPVTMPLALTAPLDVIVTTLVCPLVNVAASNIHAAIK
jgi:hypothetical protein